ACRGAQKRSSAVARERPPGFGAFVLSRHHSCLADFQGTGPRLTIARLIRGAGGREPHAKCCKSATRRRGRHGGAAARLVGPRAARSSLARSAWGDARPLSHLAL